MFLKLDFLKCNIVTMCRDLVLSSLTRLYRVQHVTASTSSCGNHAMTTQCLVKNVPPASGSIIHAICRFLQSSSNIWCMTCFRWQSTHNITVHTIRLSLKESCLEINVKDVPLFAGCNLATHPKSGWKQENRSADIPSVCPENLSIPIWLSPRGSYLVCLS